MTPFRCIAVVVYLLATVTVSSAFWPASTPAIFKTLFDLWQQANKPPATPNEPSQFAFQPPNPAGQQQQQWQATLPPPTRPTTTTTSAPPLAAVAGGGKPAAGGGGGGGDTPFGCFHKGVWYNLLSEITNGRSGDWCYGSYCDHKGEVIYWDDYNCATAPTTKRAPLLTTTTAAPVPNHRGCWHQGRWYPAGSDINNYSDYYMCYGVYCDWTSTVVHWEDSCYNTVPPAPTAPTPKPDIYKK